MMVYIPASHAADFDEVAERNPGWKVEIEANGDFIVSPNGSDSGLHDTALMKLLLRWQEGAGGYLFSSAAGFTMPDKAMLSPDASWISAERWHGTPKTQRFRSIVPDICVEVASATDSIAFLIAKLQRYRGYGATFVLLVDPFRRRTWSDGAPPPNFPTDFSSVFVAAE